MVEGDYCLLWTPIADAECLEARFQLAMLVTDCRQCSFEWSGCFQNCLVTKGKLKRLHMAPWSLSYKWGLNLSLRGLWLRWYTEACRVSVESLEPSGFPLSWGRIILQSGVYSNKLILQKWISFLSLMVWQWLGILSSDGNDGVWLFSLLIGCSLGRLIGHIHRLNI